MARDRQTVVAGAVADLEAIGSSEVGRHVIVALNKQVLRSRDMMRQGMRDAMGKGISGPGALYSRGAPTAYMVNSIQCTQTAFKEGVDEAEVSVYVKAVQGSKTADQSAVLKYYFGDGEQTRIAGDVGMSDAQIDIPQPEALILTQDIDGVTIGGPQRRGLLKTCPPARPTRRRAAASPGPTPCGRWPTRPAAAGTTAWPTATAAPPSPPAWRCRARPTATSP